MTQCEDLRFSVSLPKGRTLQKILQLLFLQVLFTNLTKSWISSHPEKMMKLYKKLIIIKSWVGKQTLAFLEKTTIVDNNCIKNMRNMMDLVKPNSKMHLKKLKSGERSTVLQKKFLII